MPKAAFYGLPHSEGEVCYVKVAAFGELQRIAYGKQSQSSPAIDLI